MDDSEHQILQYKYIYPTSQPGAVRLSFRTPVGRWVNKTSVSKTSTIKQISSIIADELLRDKLSPEDISYFLECWHLSKGKKNHRTTLNPYRTSISGHPGVLPIVGSSFIGYRVYTTVYDKLQEYGGRHKVSVAISSRTVTVSAKDLEDAFCEACIACDTMKGRYVHSNSHYLKMMKPLDWISLIKRELKIDVRRLVYGDIDTYVSKTLNPPKKLSSKKSKTKLKVKPAFTHIRPFARKQTLGFKVKSKSKYFSCYPYPFGEGWSFSLSELRRLFVEACRYIDEERGKKVSVPELYLKGLQDIDWHVLARESGADIADNFVLTKRALSNYRVENRHFRTLKEVSKYLEIPTRELAAIAGDNGIDFTAKLPDLKSRLKKSKAVTRIYANDKTYVGIKEFCKAYGLRIKDVTPLFKDRDTVRFTNTELKEFWSSFDTKSGYFVGNHYYPSITVICEHYGVQRGRVMHCINNNIELTVSLLKRLKG